MGRVTEGPRERRGLPASDENRRSPADLIIASASSAAAAVVVHALWKPGTVIAAALTPILMSLFAEALSRTIGHTPHG